MSLVLSLVKECNVVNRNQTTSMGRSFIFYVLFFPLKEQSAPPHEYRGEGNVILRFL